MFESLSTNLNKVFDKLRGRGFLNEADVDAAMREIRIALLEADVALPVAKAFISAVKEKAIGQEVLKSVSPGQMVVKIVYDHLKDMLGAEQSALNLATTPPAVVMMVGLQGSGKTTSTAKIALRLKNKQNKKTLLASLDVRRPAAQAQLATLGVQVGVATLPIIAGETPIQITRRALEMGRLEGFDVVMLDTAGRLHIDSELMQELKEVKQLSQPIETLLVADSLTGQDAVNVAREFNDQVGVTGIVLTRIDGDGRGGAALSMRQVTGCPIKFLGVGEKPADMEEFHPDRIASRILDMGDVISLVEKAAESINEQEAIDLAKKVKKGKFDLEDLASQLKNLKKMGGIGGLMGMLPGIGKIKKQLSEAEIDESILNRQLAIISSMTAKERKNADLLNGSRKRRIAMGSGVTVQEVNRLLKQYKDMSKMMKRFGKMDKKTFMRSGLGNLMPKN